MPKGKRLKATSKRGGKKTSIKSVYPSSNDKMVIKKLKRRKKETI